MEKINIFAVVVIKRYKKKWINIIASAYGQSIYREDQVKLRWKIEYHKVWEEWKDPNTSLTDGGYKYIPNGEKILQYYDESSSKWLDVEDFEEH